MLTQKYLFKDYHHRFQRKRSCENQLVMFVLKVLSRLYGAVNYGHEQTDCIIMFLGSQMCHKEGICYTHNLSYIRLQFVIVVFPDHTHILFFITVKLRWI